LATQFVLDYWVTFKEMRDFARTGNRKKALELIDVLADWTRASFTSTYIALSVCFNIGVTELVVGWERLFTLSFWFVFLAFCIVIISPLGVLRKYVFLGVGKFLTYRYLGSL